MRFKVLIVFSLSEDLGQPVQMRIICQGVSVDIHSVLI